MLEDEGTLLTWRLNVPPEQIGIEPVKAEKIDDHPLRFLTYEGPVQQNTGSVRKVDGGPFKWLKKEIHTPTFSLEGQILQGQFHFDLGCGRLARLPQEFTR